MCGYMLGSQATQTEVSSRKRDLCTTAFVDFTGRCVTISPGCADSQFETDEMEATGVVCPKDVLIASPSSFDQQ
jgi:hypothetical protein